MDGEERRSKIVDMLKRNKEPYSGTELARLLGVSRQVIVQDVALLRAANVDILSTNRGYVLLSGLAGGAVCKRLVKVSHSRDEILDELYTIVDCGGKIANVIIHHDVYGQLTGELSVASRQDAAEFMRRIEENDSRPLHELTEGLHYHTIEAANEEILNLVERKLFQKGYLVIQ